jgi:hypothetical protein
VLDHHTLGLRTGRGMTVGVTLAQYLTQEAPGHLVRVVRQIDVPVDGFHSREPARGGDVGGHLLGQGLRARADEIVDLFLRFLLGEAIQFTRGGEVGIHQFTGEEAADGRRRAPGAFEREGTEVDRPGAGIDAGSLQSRPDRFDGGLFLARDNASAGGGVRHGWWVTPGRNAG